MIEATPLQGFAGCAAALSDYDLRPGLPASTIPTLLIVGTKDATVGGIQGDQASRARIEPWSSWKAPATFPTWSNRKVLPVDRANLWGRVS